MKQTTEELKAVVETKDKRIAELEQKNKVLEITIDHCIKDWQVEQMMLEQQAKGVEKVLDLTCWSMMNTQGIDVQDVHNLIEQLRKQASGVK
jgi:hypothetical protein